MRRTTGGIAALAAAMRGIRGGGAGAGRGLHGVRVQRGRAPVGQPVVGARGAGQRHLRRPGLRGRQQHRPQPDPGRPHRGRRAGVAAVPDAVGTTIADFRLTKRIIFRNPTQDGTHRYHVITALGGHRDRGRRQLRRGHARQAQRPGTLVRLSGGQRGHRDRDRLARQLPRARRIPGRRPQPHACGSGAPRAARPAARRARPTSPTTSAAPSRRQRPGRAADLTVDASGLLRGGQVSRLGPGAREGHRPVRHPPASRSSTSPAPPRRRGRRGLRHRRRRRADRPAAPAATSASPRRARSSATARRCAPTSLQAGRRKLLVRAIDAGGNVVERGPYEAEVVSPSDRGALNGGNATESGSDVRALHARQQPHAAHDRLPLQGRRGRAAAQRRRPADHQRARRRAHARHRRRRREAAHAT